MEVIIYGVCVAVGVLFTLFSAIFGHFFGGYDAHADIGTGGHVEAGLDTHGMPGISFFSPTVLACFLTAFGAFGLVFTHIEATRSVWVSAPLAASSGGVIAWLIFLFFNWMFGRTQSSSESKVSTLEGQLATIITPIPQNGVGEIAYVQSGTRYTAPARTENGAPVGSGKTVRICRIVGTQFFVEPQN